MRKLDWSLIEQLHKDGMSGKAIAFKLSYSQSRVAGIIRNDFQSTCKFACRNCGSPTNNARRLCNKSACRTIYEREHQRDNRYLFVYGLSQSDIDTMYAAQNGLCAVCHRPVMCPIPGQNNQAKDVARIDHNHKTGKVRKLLCHRCNVGMGYFDDNTTLLRTAADYLEAA